VVSRVSSKKSIQSKTFLKVIKRINRVTEPETALVFEIKSSIPVFPRSEGITEIGFIILPCKIAKAIEKYEPIINGEDPVVWIKSFNGKENDEFMRSVRRGIGDMKRENHVWKIFVGEEEYNAWAGKKS
jgi:hypothetical protein